MAATHAVSNADDWLFDLSSEVVNHEEKITRMIIPGCCELCQKMFPANKRANGQHTIAAEFLLVHYSALALVCDIGYPDAADSDTLCLELLI